MPEGEQPNVYHPETGSNAGKWILLALMIVFVAGALFFGYDMHNKVTKLIDDQTASQQQIAALTKRMQSAEADAETLGEKIGMTKKEMATARRRVATHAAGCRPQRLAEQEKQDVNAVGRRSWQREDRCRRRQDRPRNDQGLARRDQGAIAAHDGRPRRAERTDCQHSWRSRNPEAQGRPSVLRIHAR